MKNIDIELAKKNGTIDKIYDYYVKKLIKEKYSVEDEIKILFRGSQEEIDLHEQYVDYCKEKAKELLNLK